jgi:hypothetical protein
MAVIPKRLLIVAALVLALSSCVSGGMCMWYCGDHRSGSTPLVEFLYPNGKVPPIDATQKEQILDHFC